MRIQIVLLLFAAAGCVQIFPTAPPVDPTVTFAAHFTHDRIVVDRAPGGGAGVVVPPGWFHFGHGPTFVFEQDGRRTGDVWLTAPATVDVRDAGTASGRSAGVEPTWDDNAIRLRLRTADGTMFQSDTFQRSAPGGGPTVLSRAAQSIIDVRGTYRAVLRDAKGGDVGWLRVQISPYQEASRIFDGVVPPGIGPTLAAGVAVALSSEIDWIESHTLNVYRGNDGGPLRQSVPLGR